MLSDYRPYIWGNSVALSLCLQWRICIRGGLHNAASDFCEAAMRVAMWCTEHCVRYGEYSTVQRYRIAPCPLKYCTRILTELLIYLLTYLLTPWSRILLEKLTCPQLVKKFPEFYGTRKFITTFTNARHLSLSWASSIQSIPPHLTSWRSSLILSSHLRLGLPSGSCPQVSPSKLCIHLSSPPYVLHVPPISFF